MVGLGAMRNNHTGKKEQNNVFVQYSSFTWAAQPIDVAGSCADDRAVDI